MTLYKHTIHDEHRSSIWPYCTCFFAHHDASNMTTKWWFSPPKQVLVIYPYMHITNKRWWIQWCKNQMKATINHKIIELFWQKMHVAHTKKLTMMMLFWPKTTFLWLKLHHLMIICYCFGGLLHLNVSGALEVMDICHFQSPKFNILFCFNSFKNTTRRSLELPTINSLLSLVAMKTFV
jgi:hypothetical protein